MTTTQIIAAAVISGVGSVPLTYAAAKLTTTQPVSFDVNAEAELIAAVLAEPSQYRLVCAAEPADFTWAPHRNIWAAFDSLAIPCVDMAHINEAKKSGVPALTLKVTEPEDLRAAVIAALEKPDDLSELDGVREDVPVLRSGRHVIEAAADRNAYAGSSAVQNTGERDTPMRRIYAAPRLARLGIVAGIAATGAAAATYAASGGWLVVTAILCWTFVLSVIALVDYDTMYIDMRVFWAGSALSLGLAVAAAGTSELRTALTYSVGAVAGLWIFGALYRKLRGVTGLGAGDLFLVGPLMAFPILLGATPAAAFTGLWVGMVAAVLVVGIGVASGRRRRDAAFAFGPYLALGWPFGWALTVFLSI
jgi:hypothetical protein